MLKPCFKNENLEKVHQYLASTMVEGPRTEAEAEKYINLYTANARHAFLFNITAISVIFAVGLEVLSLLNPTRHPAKRLVLLPEITAVVGAVYFRKATQHIDELAKQYFD